VVGEEMKKAFEWIRGSVVMLICIILLLSPNHSPWSECSQVNPAQPSRAFSRIPDREAPYEKLHGFAPPARVIDLVLLTHR